MGQIEIQGSGSCSQVEHIWEHVGRHHVGKCHVAKDLWTDKIGTDPVEESLSQKRIEVFWLEIVMVLIMHLFSTFTEKACWRNIKNNFSFGSFDGLSRVFLNIDN